MRGICLMVIMMAQPEYQLSQNNPGKQSTECGASEIEET
jgi:hypothetical protein